MKKELLISLSVIGLMAGSNALAQTCTTPPSCDTLGFTESEADCGGGKMLKCPFDQTKVFCAGNATTNAKPGDIYYSDGTFSSEVIASKTPIGVVAYVNGSNGFVVALEESSKTWSSSYYDIPCLTNLSGDSARVDMNGKTNTQCIINTKSSTGYSYPAAEYCNSLKPVSTGKGSSGWYLPAAGEIYVIQYSLVAINLGLQKLSKTQISSGYYWSSSEGGGNTSAWGVRPSDGTMYYYTYTKSNSYPVRCVLAF